ncbi:hypothetical protein DFP72DRAFT_848886 [Ephemerocybe angulata]|uniref:Uncharacterized protein n=1 Tax=Ephemerocybe angulata TaxID=980116 RepID=A0A8H6M3V2_9AGAR|nr:hypothetical protein DFP72DRAFT_848886 [Tulosesus angulatus]
MPYVEEYKDRPWQSAEISENLQEHLEHKSSPDTGLAIESDELLGARSDCSFVEMERQNEHPHFCEGAPGTFFEGTQARVGVSFVDTAGEGSCWIETLLRLVDTSTLGGKNAWAMFALSVYIRDTDDNSPPD